MRGFFITQMERTPTGFGVIECAFSEIKTPAFNVIR